MMRCFPAALMTTALLATALLAAPAFADADDDQALLILKTAMAETCSGGFTEDGQPITPPERWQVQSPNAWDSTPEPMTIWQFECMRGAYNISHVFLAKTEYDGIRILSFATPDLQITHTDPDDFESPVTGVTHSGWRAVLTLVNAQFDPQKLEIYEHSAWRGIGDASSAGVWMLMNEGFTLTRFDVDASYDGEMNPEHVYPAP